MITPSTRAHAGRDPSVDARITARTERGGDFRDEIARSREPERSNARSNDAARSSPDSSRSSADAERTSTRANTARDDAGEHESVHEEGTADASTSTAASEGETLDADVNGVRFGDGITDRPAQTATNGRPSTPKDGIAPDAAQAEAALVVPSTTNPAAIETLDASHGLEARLHALFTIGDDVTVEDRALQATTTPITTVGTAATATSTAATTPIVDLDGHAGAEIVRTAQSTTGTGETSSSAIAALSGRNAPTPDVAATAPTSVPRLSPADLPQFFETVQVRVDGAQGNAFVELEPPELGRLTFELSLQPDGGVRADVRAENQDGFAALGARVAEMRAALLDRGFTSADVQISLGLGERDSHRDSDSKPQRGSRNETTRELDAERVLALARSGAGSIDVWA